MLRVLLFLALLLTPLPLQDALARGKSIKIATIVPNGTPWMSAVRRSAKQIARRTGRRVKFQFFPGGVMGNDKSVLRKIRIGLLQGGALTGGGLVAILPDTAIYSIPFAFRSFAEVNHVRTILDPLLLKDLKNKGFISFGFSEVGFAYLMSNKPIRSMADLRGKKVWVPEGDHISRAAFEASGVSPVPLPLTDVLTGLQTGLIDTIGAPAIGAIALQWHTRVKYMTNTPLAYLYGSLVLDKKVFDGISQDDQAVVRSVMAKTMRVLDQQSRRSNQEATRAMQYQGIRLVNLPEAEWRRWRDQVTLKLADTIEKSGISTSRLRKFQKALDAFRKQGNGRP